MKLRLLFCIFIVAAGLQSCESEYGERMSKAKKLTQQYRKVQDDMFNSKNPVLKIQLGRLEKEIRFQATLSGNEKLFLREVWHK